VWFGAGNGLSAGNAERPHAAVTPRRGSSAWPPWRPTASPVSSAASAPTPAWPRIRPRKAKLEGEIVGEVADASRAVDDEGWRPPGPFGVL